MKPIRLSILTLLLLSSALMQGQSDTISWHDGVKITWADFKGAPNKSVPYFANTTYLISIGYKYRGSDAKIHVGCYFDRDKSWVIKSKEKDSLLLHEKLHFAIAELFARKARKIITDTALQASDINNVLNAIDERVMKECDEYQDQGMARGGRRTQRGNQTECG